MPLLTKRKMACSGASLMRCGRACWPKIIRMRHAAERTEVGETEVEIARARLSGVVPRTVSTLVSIHRHHSKRRQPKGHDLGLSRLASSARRALELKARVASEPPAPASRHGSFRDRLYRRIPRKTYDTQLYGVAHNPELALSSGRALGGLEGPRPSPADMWLK